MVRPRNEPIEVTQEKQMERWTELSEELSRRKLMELFGAGSVAAMAGCGGGGQETPTETEAPGQETPTPTPTPGGGQETPTATPGADQETPTETATRADTPTTVQTPAGEVTITDQVWRDVTDSNFEQFQPNPWNAEGYNNVSYQELFLACADNIPIDPRIDEIGDLTLEDWTILSVLLGAAEGFKLNPQNNMMTMNIHEGLTWGDGAPFDAKNVMMHADIVRTMIEIGEATETVMPATMEIVDDTTIKAQLLPGNVILRWIATMRETDLAQVQRTHPELHREFVESVRNATTQGERTKAIRDLFNGTFPAEELPTMTLGPFKPVDWQPDKMILDAREDFPWGLSYNPDNLDRVFGRVQMNTVGEQVSILNAAATGKKDWICEIPNRRTREQRFPEENWFHWNAELLTTDAETVFSPKSKWGQKSEKARMMRQAVAFTLDAEEVAQINGLYKAVEQTTGLHFPYWFNAWLGNDYFFENFTNYGHQETGYNFPEKGRAKLRKAGFSRNKNGVWVDGANGEPLAPEVLLKLVPGRGQTRPVVTNIVEQLNRNGINATGKILDDDQLNNRIVDYNFEMAVLASNFAMGPHPYFGYTDDAMLGSKEGIPGGVNLWDYRNGYRRVDVPMPVGNPDGEMTTYDYDQRVLEMIQITDTEEMKNRVREVSWVLNQWVPAVLTIRRTEFPAMNKRKIELHDSFFNPDKGNVGSTMVFCENQAIHHGAGFVRPK